MSANQISLMDQVIARHRVIVTCGTGGVGKTTLSAALALRAARLGKKAIVITIDPAKRLATSLGLKDLGDEPTDLTPRLNEVLGKNGIDPLGSGQEFHALIPDTRQTFETFVASLASDQTQSQRILNNPIFKIFAREFSGTNEYMALQKLFAIDSLGKYDCIILDTPPSRNTLAFLDAPQLLARFFDEKIIHWLVMPANRLVSAGMRMGLELLEKLTGAGFMTHLFDFAASLFEVRIAFTANLKRISSLLQSDQVGFLLVATPTPEVAPEAAHFIQSVKDHDFNFLGVALNRTLSYLKSESQTQKDPNPELKKGYEIVSALQSKEKSAVAELESRLGKFPILARLPELARDVHSIHDLYQVSLGFGFTGDVSSSGRMDHLHQ